jgi:hypothetical protein
MNAIEQSGQYDSGDTFTREEYRRTQNGDGRHIGVCLHCVQQFPKKRPAQRFCSPRCAGKYNAARRAPAAREFGMCEECREQFPKKRSDSRFCGTRCAAAHDRRQGYAEQPAPPAAPAAIDIAVERKAPDGGPRDGSPGSLEHVPAGADSREVGPDDDPTPAAGRPAPLQETPTASERINALLGLALVLGDSWSFTATIGDVDITLRRAGR